MARIIKQFIGLGVVLLIAAQSAAPGFARSAKDILAAMPRATLSQFIRPAYNEFFKQTKQLDQAIERFCNAPSDLTRAHVDLTFAEAVLGYGKIEHLRFGPAAEKYRLERLHYWPDRKGRGVRRLRKLLKARDQALLKTGALSDKSVAIQGLGALEYVLYGKGSEALLENNDSDDYRCRFGVAVAKNISAIAGEIAAAWAEDQKASRLFLTAGEQNERYRTHKEVIAEIYKSITSGLKFLHDLKIMQLLGETAETAKPKRAAFWRSGLAVRFMKTNLAAINELATVSGFVELLPSAGLDLRQHVKRVIGQINKTIDGFPADPAKIVREEKNRQLLKQLLKQISHVNAGYSRHFAVAADLPLGFNAADGD